MTILDYAHNLWIEESLDTPTFNVTYLVHKGKAYLEVKEYFSKHYGIEVTCATYKSTEKGVKLQLILKDTEIDAKTLYNLSSDAIFGSICDWSEDYGDYASSYILIDIKNVEK